MKHIKEYDLQDKQYVCNLFHATKNLTINFTSNFS